MAQGGDTEVQRVKEAARKKVEQVEEILTSRINLLEEVSFQSWSMVEFITAFALASLFLSGTSRIMTCLSVSSGAAVSALREAGQGAER